MCSTCVPSVVFIWLLLIVPFKTELAVNTNVTVSDIHHNVSKMREEMGGKVCSVSTSRIQPIDYTRVLTIA